MLGYLTKKDVEETEPKKVKNGYEVKIINAKSGKPKSKKKWKEKA